MQYWDDKGRLHDTEDKGRISLGQSLANQARAGLTNLNSWINETNPNSDAYKQKASIIAGLATLPAGMGTKATQLVTNTLKPYVGRKLAQMTAEGIGGGVVGGLVEGGLDSGLHNENIIQGALKGSAMGATAGGLGGYGLGKIGQGLARKGVSKSTENATQYFNDYIDDLADKSKVMNDFRGLRAGVSGQGDILDDQIAWHGSPYDFDKFSNDAIGSGEGAQVHGMGHYVALDKNIADSRYKNRLSDGYKVEGEVVRFDPSQYNFNPNSVLDDINYYGGVENALKKYNNELSEAQKLIDDFESKYSPEEIEADDYLNLDYFNAQDSLENIPEKLDLLNSFKGKQIEKNEGTLYKVNIPDDDVFLREDLPFSQQPQKVQDALKNILSEENVDNIVNNLEILQNKIKKERRTNGETEYLNSLIKEWEGLNNKYGVLFNLEPNNLISNGKTLYSNLVDYAGNPQKASQLLNDYGIKGISYDGGIDGEARVIFNPDDIKILEKNGQLVNRLLRDNKQAQLDLINKYNPAPDDYHTWIRNIDDIKNFEDTLKDIDEATFTPDFSEIDAQNAIKNGKIKVFSSYPIDKGVFVTPSQMEAQSYAGGKKLYSQEIPLSDIAWLDNLQGQYAPIIKGD